MRELKHNDEHHKCPYYAINVNSVMCKICNCYIGEVKDWRNVILCEGDEFYEENDNIPYKILLIEKANVSVFKIKIKYE